MIEIKTHSAEETRALGVVVGRRLGPGTVLAFHGDLGCGKTVFAQGLAKGLDVPDEYYITSPSYTLINEYPGRHPFFHVDLYRLGGPFDVEDIGLTDIIRSQGVCAIEWAERIEDDLPADHLVIDFQVLDENVRRIRISGRGKNATELIKVCRRVMG